MHRLETFAGLAGLAALAAAAWWASAPKSNAVTLDELRSMATALVAAAPELPGLAANVRGVELFPLDEMADPVRKTVRRGKYNRLSGVVYVAVTSHTGVPLPRDVVAGVVAHELAHAATVGDHHDEWRAAYVQLLAVATERLGWSVRLECSSCPFYKVCGNAQCPRCTWKTCKAGGGTGGVTGSV
jgi:hypothetical protein